MGGKNSDSVPISASIDKTDFFFFLFNFDISIAVAHSGVDKSSMENVSTTIASFYPTNDSRGKFCFELHGRVSFSELSELNPSPRNADF